MRVVGVDLSAEAIATARATHGDAAEFRVADMSAALPFVDASFDAVMANVSLHMFSDAATRSIFEEVRRVLRPGGLVAVPRQRARRSTAARAGTADHARAGAEHVLAEAGQRVRYFPREYLVDLLAGWQIVTLEHVELEYPREAGSFQKRVWRGVARTL